MSEHGDPTRGPGFDDEPDGLDCFATEAVPVTGEARGTAKLEEVRPAAPAASLPPEPVRRAEQRAVEVAKADWPAMRVTAVALVLLIVGVIGMWMHLQRERPVATVASTPSSPPSVTPSAPVAPNVAPAPSAARPAAAGPVAAPVTGSRDAAVAPIARPTIANPVSANPTSPRERRAAVVPSPTPAPPQSSRASNAPDALLLEAPPPAVAVERAAIAEPESVRAEPVPEAASARAAIVAPPTDRASIERVLQQYREAYDRLDAPSAAVIWPRVDTRALSRAFSTLASQNVSFERCDLAIFGVKANAQCTGAIRYVRRVGDQEPRVRRTSWSFAFERVSDRWQIAQVAAD